MSSGVTISPDVLPAYHSLKQGRQARYLILRLSDDLKSIIVEKTGTDNNYETFLQDLPELECRWAVYDFEYEKEGEGKRSKLIFFSWSPDSAKIKSKMVYASSRDALRRSLDGISAEIQGTDPSEVEHVAVLDKVTRLR